MALSADRNNLDYRGTLFLGEMDVSASQTTYVGSILEDDGNGNLAPLTDAANKTVVGVSREQKDNSSGDNGDLTVEFHRKGSVVRMPHTGSVQYGQTLYATDDEDVGAGTGSNSIRVGIALDTKGLNSNEVWVYIDPES